MSTKTISITEEAYGRLASKKEPHESFSEIILKITGKTSLRDIAGVLTEKEASELRKHIKERREVMRRRMDTVADKLH
jgi:predicted CopG family antitoxin